MVARRHISRSSCEVIDLTERHGKHIKHTRIWMANCIMPTLVVRIEGKGAGLSKDLPSLVVESQVYTCCYRINQLIGPLSRPLTSHTIPQKSASISPEHHDHRRIGFIGPVASVGLCYSSIARDLSLAPGVPGSIRTTAIYTTVLSNRLKVNISRNLVPAATRARVPASRSLDPLKDLTEADISAVRQAIEDDVADIMAVEAASKVAYAHFFRVEFLATIVSSTVFLGASVFVPNI